MQLNPQVFREYDIRGTVDRDLSDEFAYLLGRAYASLAIEHKLNRIAIGYDARLSSPAYTQALSRGMNDSGVDTVLTGMGPTPQLYYAVYAHNLGGGIQVTGSHNPPDMNGFKILLGQHTLSGDEIQDLRVRCEKLLKSNDKAATTGSASTLDIRPEYIAQMVANSKSHMGPRKLKVVVDGGNGVGGLVGPAVLRALGVEVIELYCDPDGRFPNHHPDPTVMENIIELRRLVIETKADFGVGWDGDADRIGVVDERGEVIFGDMLMLLYGREILKSTPGATIIGDVKCSSRLFDELGKAGANAVMWKTGHSLIKNKLKELKGELGGEVSGHIFFKHRYFGFDDALYATSRLAEIVSHHQGAVSNLLKNVPTMLATPEIRVDCPEEIKFKIPELARSAFKEFELNTIDGVRISFPHGWGLIRASNTQPVLVMRFEATTQQFLDEYQELVAARVEGIKSQLASS